MSLNLLDPVQNIPPLGDKIASQGTTSLETNNIVWHYTTGNLLPLILKDGLVRLATANIDEDERPAVWFSSNQIWEKTSTKGMITSDSKLVTLTKEEMCRLCDGLARISVERNVAPHNWEAYKKMSGVSAKMAGGMKQSAYTVGARISEWFVSFEAVPCEKWLGIEVWNGSSWEPYAPSCTHDRSYS